MKRRLATAALIVAAILFVGGVTFVASSTVSKLATQQQRTQQLARRVAVLQAAQIAANKVAAENRVRNVYKWCSAINQGRDDARRRSRYNRRHILPGLKPYTLPDLNCRQQAVATLESTRLRLDSAQVHGHALAPVAARRDLR